MIDLCRKCGVSEGGGERGSLTTRFNEECTIQNMVASIIEVGQKCAPGDTFLFYYTGHGDQLPNDNGDNGEAMDQCLCTVDNNGNTDDATMTLRQQVWMRDDVFAKAILDATKDPEVTAIALIDACHSGTICDFTEDSEWAKRQQRAISISGCEDTQTSAGTGKGGYFTRALTQAVQDLTEQQSDVFNVATVFNKTLEEYQKHKGGGHTQSITIHGCKVRPNEMAWPLQPPGVYKRLSLDEAGLAKFRDLK